MIVIAVLTSIYKDKNLTHFVLFLNYIFKPVVVRLEWFC